MRRIACYLLVDGSGRLLMQEKDDDAPRGANQWFVPGGHVEDDEEFETAVYREVAEETGLVLGPDSLVLWRDETLSRDGEEVRYQLWTGATGATDADIVVGEGRQIVFVEPAAIPTLDLWESAAHFLPLFLSSPAYAALCDR